MMEYMYLDKTKIKSALELVWKVFLVFEANDYSQEGIDEFKRFIDDNSIMQMMDEGILEFYGCYDDEKIIGVIATKNINHVCMFFVDQEYHRQGIGSKLYEIVKEKCIIKCKNNITVNSSPYALEIYRRLGFIEKDEIQTTNGIKYIPMESIIDS